MDIKTDQSVLVIDDELFMLKSAAFILKDLGFQNVITADSANQAISLMEQADPAVGLVISDLNMPGMDGLELLRHFVDADYQGHIIIFSGEDSKTLAMAEKLAQEHNLGILGSIEKPMTVSKTRDLLDPLFSGDKSQGKKTKPIIRNSPKLITADMIANGIEQRQFEPWFQPKIDMTSLLPVGVEALARWPDSSSGPVFPNEFISVAEQHNLIEPLTMQIVEKSIQAQNAWIDSDIKLKIALNISMDSLADLSFADRLYELIGKNRGSAERLQLEVTESRMMNSLAAPLEVLLRLRMKKISLSIDDFGTGHSTFSQLRDLPFDEIKLDSSYVRGAANNLENQSILESSIGMAKKLGLNTVAEGVEDLADWNLMKKLGCDQVQGYFVAKPMPAKELLDWFVNWPNQKKQLFGA